MGIIGPRIKRPFKLLTKTLIGQPLYREAAGDFEFFVRPFIPFLSSTLTIYNNDLQSATFLEGPSNIERTQLRGRRCSMWPTVRHIQYARGPHFFYFPISCLRATPTQVSPTL